MTIYKYNNQKEKNYYRVVMGIKEFLEDNRISIKEDDNIKITKAEYNKAIKRAVKDYLQSVK